MYVLRLQCMDQPGIVAAVASSLSLAGGNIEESAQYHDPLSGQFFMRVVFSEAKKNAAQKFAEDFVTPAQKFGLSFDIRDALKPLSTLILVSKPDHCLNDLLYRWRTKNLPVDIVGVVSNHPDCRDLVLQHNLPFTLLPEGKAAQEKEIAQLFVDREAELMVLARYMQILSPALCSDFPEQIINIHHSFLPGFKGAKPYHQAYARGVKIIGATAHFVTADLDEGPIIAQETAPVTHADTPDKLIRTGQDIETRVLARAIRHYAEHRIFVHGPRTVIL